MNQLTSNHTGNSLLVFFIMFFVLPSPAFATGPRVTTALFSADKSEIHAVDFPPFVSSDVVDGGAISELVNTALARGGVDAVISTHPIQRMVRYYLLQEDAMAVIGWHFQLTAEQKKHLILIPITRLPEKYFYYKPRHPNGLMINDVSLKGLRYGAHKGEDTSTFEKAGVEVQYGRSIALLKKLKNNELDFICSPPKTVEWLLDRYMSDEKENFVSTAGDAEKQLFYIVFNRKHADGEMAADKFNKALKDMVNDGTYGKIVEKHLGKGDDGKLYLRRLETFK